MMRREDCCTKKFLYNSVNRLSAFADVIDGKSYTTDQEYNEAGQLTRVGSVYTGYDNSGRISSVTGAGVNFAQVTYNVAGQVTGDQLLTFGGTVNETFTYDSNRMRKSSQTALKGATTLLNLQYNYQATAGQHGAGTTAGNTGELMGVTGTINGSTELANYTYDLRGRLATSSQTTNGVSAQRRFEYDEWDNRTRVWDAVSGGSSIQQVTLLQGSLAPTNRIQSILDAKGSAAYSYDASGNVLNDGQHSYQYDGENRLVNVDGGVTAQYGYDQANRRIKKVAAGVTTHYIWKGNQVLREHNGITGALVTSYAYASSRLLGKQTNGVTRSFLMDRLSIRVALDSFGNIVGRQGHLPFGEEIGASGDKDKHQFTTYERDSETDLDYAVNRYKDQTAGRFLSVDPLKASAKKESPRTWNRYTYALNDPINLIDPFGAEAFTHRPPIVDFSLANPCEPGGPTVFYDGFELSSPVNCTSLIPLTGPGEPVVVRPTCNISASGSGEITRDVPKLRYPDGTRRRGRTGTSRTMEGQTVSGWFWNIEISASVSDNVGLWKIHQEGFLRVNGTVIMTATGEISPFNFEEFRDDGGKERIHPSNIVQIPNHLWLFWIDAPGVAVDSRYKPYTWTYLFRARSWISQGSVICEIKWTREVKWENGVLKSDRWWAESPVNSQ